MEYNKSSDCRDEKAKKALMVIDMQVDFTEENGKFPVEKCQINNLIPAVNDLIDEFDQNNNEIIYVWNIFKKEDETNQYRNYSGIEGTDGVKINPKIKVISKNIFEKFAPSAFSNETLQIFLDKNEITELFICGVMAECCVLRTALDAVSRNFKVNYISKAVGALNLNKIDEIITKLKNNGVNII